MLSSPTVWFNGKWFLCYGSGDSYLSVVAAPGQLQAAAYWFLFLGFHMTARLEDFLRTVPILVCTVHVFKM